MPLPVLLQLHEIRPAILCWLQVKVQKVDSKLAHAGVKSLDCVDTQCVSRVVVRVTWAVDH